MEVGGGQTERFTTGSALWMQRGNPQTDTDYLPAQAVTFALLLARVLADVRLRVSNGEFSERQLARRVHISQPQLHNVLKGARTLTPALADRLLVSLDIRLSILSGVEFRDSRRDERDIGLGADLFHIEFGSEGDDA